MSSFAVLGGTEKEYRVLPSGCCQRNMCLQKYSQKAEEFRGGSEFFPLSPGEPNAVPFELGLEG